MLGKPSTGRATLQPAAIGEVYNPSSFLPQVFKPPSGTYNPISEKEEMHGEVGCADQGQWASALPFTQIWLQPLWAPPGASPNLSIQVWFWVSSEMC